jgi:hypothetical protein
MTMAPNAHDVETQVTAIELEEPLITGNDENDKGNEDREDGVKGPAKIGGIPSVRKPGYGNLMWAEQQCQRRCGLSVDQAKLMHKAYGLYQTEGDPKSFIVQSISTIFPPDLLGRWKIEQAREEKRRAQWRRRAMSRSMKTFASIEKMSGLVVQIGVLQTATAVLSIYLARMTSFLAFSTARSFDSRVLFAMAFMELYSIIMKSFVPNQEVVESEHQSTDVEPEIFSSQWVDTITHRLNTGSFDPTKLDKVEFKHFVERFLSSSSPVRDHGVDNNTNPMYIIIGWFSQGSLDPKEKLLRLKNETVLFEQMRQGAKSLRGWRMFLSLKSLHSFGLYKVSTYKQSQLC